MAKKKTNQRKKAATPKSRPRSETRAAKPPAAQGRGKPTIRKKQTSARTAARKSTDNSTCYVTVSPLQITVAGQKPKDAPPSAACANFEQAREAAMDGLLERIEEAERKLLACKRAATLDELRSL